MLRFTTACVLALALFPRSLAAQQMSQSGGAGSVQSPSALVVRLLQESHDLGAQLPTETHLSLLRRQVQMITPLSADLGREWADELSILSSQVEGIKRAFAQQASLAAMAQSNPDRALDLLHSLTMEETIHTVTLPKIMLARHVFQGLATREGERALPVLEREAGRMANEGHFPYSALGYAATLAVSKDASSDKRHAEEVLQSVFELAFQNYSQNSRSYLDDLDFGEMLQVVSGGLAPDVMRPALRKWVDNLLGTDTRKFRLEAEFSDGNGNVLKADNAIDAAILYFGRLINRVDPQLAEELQSARPELKPILESVKDGKPSTVSIGWQAEEGESSEQEDTRAEILSIMQHSPEAAIAKARQLPAGQRSSVELDVARGIAGDFPDRAAELISEVEAQEVSPDSGMESNLLSAWVSLAAAQGKKDELRHLLERAFSATSYTASQQLLKGSVYLPGAGALVQIGVQNEPDLTITFIHSLAPARLKAELLLSAAAALNMPSRFPLRFHQHKGTSKPD